MYHPPRQIDVHLKTFYYRSVAFLGMHLHIDNGYVMQAFLQKYISQLCNWLILANGPYKLWGILAISS